MLKQSKGDIKVRKNRLLLWLILLLSILLVAAVGAFVFLSLNARYRFACVFGCKQRENPVAGEQRSSPTGAASNLAVHSRKTTVASEIERAEEPTKKGPATRTTWTLKSRALVKTENDTITRYATPSTPSTDLTGGNNTSAVAKTSLYVEKSTSRPSPVTYRPTRKPRVHRKRYIRIRGKIFLKDKARKRFPLNSWLIVEFLENRYLDAPSILLGKTDVSNRRRGKIISYTITCKRQELPRSSYSVSAVLNMGWKRTNENPWIRKGDFLTDTTYDVKVNKLKKVYYRNIHLVRYS